MSRSEEVRALMSSAAARPAVDALSTQLPDDVTAWLGELGLLDGIPFNAIVPDSRMLPPESVRFFYLDDNWLAALRDGALSVVDLSEQDSAMLSAQRPRIGADMHAAAAHTRVRRRARARRRSGAPDPAPVGVRSEAPPPRPWTGMLLRSAVVADWPGLSVKCYSDSGGDLPLDLLRLERLAPTVLLGIFGGVAQRVSVAKPAQGLHFGVSEDDDGKGYLVYLRGLGGAFPAGKQLADGSSVAVTLRTDPVGRVVLDIGATQKLLDDTLVTKYRPQQSPPVGAGAFGLEMIAGAEMQVFVPNPKGP